MAFKENTEDDTFLSATLKAFGFPSSRFHSSTPGILNMHVSSRIFLLHLTPPPLNSVGLPYLYSGFVGTSSQKDQR